MCITKSKNDITTMFSDHVIDELDFIKIPMQESSWTVDKTTKRMFEEVDGHT